MSKWTPEKLRVLADYLAGCDVREAPDALLEYAAHLAAQAEWPSDEDVQKARLNGYATAREELLCEIDRLTRENEALQSVRPPVGVDGYVLCKVPDEIGIELCAPISVEWMARRTGYREGWNKCREAMLASRHAPTKD